MEEVKEGGAVVGRRDEGKKWATWWGRPKGQEQWRDYDKKKRREATAINLVAAVGKGLFKKVRTGEDKKGNEAENNRGKSVGNGRKFW